MTGRVLRWLRRRTTGPVAVSRDNVVIFGGLAAVLLALFLIALLAGLWAAP